MSVESLSNVKPRSESRLGREREAGPDMDISRSIFYVDFASGYTRGAL